MGAWSPVSGNSYFFQVNWDIDMGDTRLWIDGVQKGNTLAATGTRDSDVGILRIGKGANVDRNTNFKVEAIVVFSSPQTVRSNWTGIPTYTYCIDNPKVIFNNTFRHESLNGFIETCIKTGGDDAKYILKKGVLPASMQFDFFSRPSATGIFC